MDSKPAEETKKHEEEDRDSYDEELELFLHFPEDFPCPSYFQA